MANKTLEKYELLKAMHTIVQSLNHEGAYFDRWILIIPDGATDEDLHDIAEDEDATLLIEELKTLGEEFRADMKAAFPNAKDEHLKGKVFDAKDVMGILCDGQMMLGQVISRVFNLANGTEQPIARTASRKIAKRSATAASASTVGSGSAAVSAKANTLSTTLNSINMKEQFPAVFALLGIEEMQVSEEGTFFNKDLLATLNANIEAAQKEKADALALVESLTAEKNDLTAKVENLTAQAETKEAEHAKAIEDLNAAHATALEEKDNQISALEQEKADLQGEVNAKAESIEAMQTELNGAKESLTTAQNTIAERDQQISDLNATIDEMKQDAGAPGAASPANNGEGVEVPQVAIGTQYTYDNSLSYEENMKRKKEWEAEHK